MRSKPRERAAAVTRFLPGIARFAASLLLAALAVAASMSIARALPSEQAATPASTAAPSATPSPADLTLAASFAQDGRFADSAGAYKAVLARSPAADRLAARLGLAQLYYADGQFGTAARELDAYLFEAPASADVRDAQLLLAEALQRKGAPAEALPLYDAYISASGAASAYARIGRAQVLALLGRTDDANAETSSLANDASLPAQARRALVLGVAQALEQSSPADAAAWYDKLRQMSPSREEAALAHYRAAALRGSSAWQTIIQRYPDSSMAAQIVDAPPVGVLVDSYYTGLVYYYAGRDAAARSALQASLDKNAVASATLAARAAFYLGALDERDGDAQAAAADYGRVPQLEAKSDLADDALWWQGRVLERAERPDDARTAYERIVSDYGSSSVAPEARFRLALLLYDAGHYGEAASAFDAIAKVSHDVEQQRALLWQGKSLAAAGDKNGAKATWQSLSKSAPDDYYGLRAAVLLGGGQGQLKQGSLRQRAADWSSIEEWLRDAKGADPAVSRQALLADAHWAAGTALLRAGLRREAAIELGQLLANASGDAGMLLQLARAFDGIGVHDLSARAAAAVLRQVPADVAAKAPGDLWRAAYPAPFSDAVDDAAAAENVPETLLLALVRQESFFDPLAGSRAGAQGLTQVVPSTGEAIADELQVQPFEDGDLFRPALSLRFGAHYLRQQLDRFDGNLYEALAAYNGGPGNAQSWQRAARGDTDRFVAEIELPETSLYIRLVSENLARYRQLYEGLSVPALPKD